MSKLLIVDGSNLLFQMFFGMPARIINHDGKAIQGTLGFVGALLKIIRKVEPTHVVVLFDGEHENDRTKLNSEYKSNRIDYSEIPEDKNPFSQLSDIYDALNFLGILHTETVNCEVDDWIASYALTYGGENEIVISSFDSDFFQLITDNVYILRYRSEKTVICTSDYIHEKFNIKPSQYVDFKSLIGDNADNIKGAQKVGPKTAAVLINDYGNLENILANAEDIKKPSIRKSIMESAERLRINYKLIELKNRVKVPFNKNQISFSYNGITTIEVLRGIGLK